MKTNKRTEIVAIKLSPEEKALIQAAADAMGMTISTYVRWKLIIGEKDKEQN